MREQAVQDPRPPKETCLECVGRKSVEQDHNVAIAACGMAALAIADYEKNPTPKTRRALFDLVPVLMAVREGSS